MHAAVQSSLSSEQRDRALAFLQETRAKFSESVAGLSDEQWTFQPSEEGWSIAGVVEHVALLENNIHKIVRELLTDGEGGSTPKSAMDEMIFTEVPTRVNKISAPERAHPKGRWSGPEALQVFLDARAKTPNLLDIPELRNKFFTHPLFGPWDGYQWVIGTAAHSARHAAQIREIRESAAFPRS